MLIAKQYNIFTRAVDVNKKYGRATCLDEMSHYTGKVTLVVIYLSHTLHAYIFGSSHIVLEKKAFKDFIRLIAFKWSRDI